jgi:hypothetical protein
MKQYYFLFAFLGLSVIGNAQSVSFTSTIIPGFTQNYTSCVVDMDGDYLDDLVTVTNGNLNVFKQLPEGGFNEVSYSVTGMGSGYLTPDWSIAAGDYDANGFTDLVFGNNSRVSVIKANATGTGYTTTTYPDYIFTQRTNFIDIDNDGNLDLFACHDVDQSHVFRNDGAGNLTFDQTLMETLDVGGNYATIWMDYNNDGFEDMYLAKCRGGAPVGDPQRINLLYKNNGDGTFTESGAEAGVNDGAQSWSTAIEDFDNDGDMDMILSNISDENRFYQNNGDGTFTDIYSTSGLPSSVGSWEIQSADFNNDGFMDILWSDGDRLYLNNGDNTFTSAFADGGTNNTEVGPLGDLNNDGFVDIHTSNKVLYNDGNPNKWIKVTLQGVESNRNGIGARVEIYGAWGKQIRDIRSGTSFSTMSSLNAYFGIGSATAITKAVVRWPSGNVDVIPNPSTNSTLFVLEGSSPELGVANQTVHKFSVSPNPASDVINFNFTNQTQIATAKVFDLSGRMVLASNISQGQQQLSVQALANGTYMLLLTDGKGKNYSQKFIKK